MYLGSLDSGLKYVLFPTSGYAGENGIVTVATVYNVGSYDELGTQEVSPGRLLRFALLYLTILGSCPSL